MRRMTTLLAAAIIALACVPAAIADGTSGEYVKKDAKISNLNIGTYWFGPRITNKDLVGKVVLVEIWGS